MHTAQLRRSRGRKLLPLLVVFALVYLGVLVYSFMGPAEGASREEVPTVETIYAFDTTDPRKLVGFSDSVFIGKAEKRVGEEPLTSTIPGTEGDTPRVQYEVSVEDLLKEGSLSPGDKIVVNQKGGEDPDTGKKVEMVAVVNGCHFPDELLEEGERYLFSVRQNKAEGRYDLSAQPHGKVPIDGASQEAKTSLIGAFERAVEDPVDPLASPGASGASSSSAAAGGGGS